MKRRPTPVAERHVVLAHLQGFAVLAHHGAELLGVGAGGVFKFRGGAVGHPILPGSRSGTYRSNIGRQT